MSWSPARVEWLGRGSGSWGSVEAIGRAASTDARPDRPTVAAPDEPGAP